jgi:hypothetical protein
MVRLYLEASYFRGVLAQLKELPIGLRSSKRLDWARVHPPIWLLVVVSCCGEHERVGWATSATW